MSINDYGSSPINKRHALENVDVNKSQKSEALAPQNEVSQRAANLMQDKLDTYEVSEEDLESKPALNKRILAAYDTLLQGDTLVSKVLMSAVLDVNNIEISKEDLLKLLFEKLSSPESVLSKDLPEKMYDFERIATHIGGRGVTPVEINKLQQLNCAGRSAILARLLDMAGVEYFVTSPKDHSLVIARLDSGYVYMDPQQGVLVRNIPESAIKLTSDESLGVKFLQCDVDQFPRADYQGLGFIHAKMNDSSVGEQFLSNVRQPLDPNDQDNHALFTYLDSVERRLKGVSSEVNLNDFNEGIDDILSDSFNNSGMKVRDLFLTLARFDWQVSQEVLVKFKGLYPGCDTVDAAQALVDRWMVYHSRGQGDELFDALARMFGFVNFEGLTIREILIAGRMKSSLDQILLNGSNFSNDNPLLNDLKELGTFLTELISNTDVDVEVKKKLFAYIIKVSEFVGYHLSSLSPELWSTLNDFDISIVEKLYESEAFNYLRFNKVSRVDLNDFNCDLEDEAYSFHQPEFGISHVFVSKFPGRTDDRFAVDVFLEPNKVYHSTVDGKVVGVNHLPVDRDLQLMDYVEGQKSNGESLTEDKVRELFQIKNPVDEYALECTIKYYRDYLESNCTNLGEYLRTCNVFLSDREGYGFDLNSKVVALIIQKKLEGVEKIVESDVEGIVESSVIDETLKILNEFLSSELEWGEFFGSKSLAKHLSNSVEVLDNQGVTHLFSHVELVAGLDVGAEVTVGDDLYKISYNSGDSTVPHLHYSAFEMKEGGDGTNICQPVPLVDAGESEVQLYRTNLPGFDKYIRSKL